MRLSKRVENITESVTLKLNSKAVALSEEGKQIFNLTAGQLPFRPSQDFTQQISKELEFLKSYQYSPVPGFPELRKKLVEHVEVSRSINFKEANVEVDVVVGNGGKHVLSNIFSALIDPGDEVVLLAPYWVSYSQMVELNGGHVKVVSANVFDGFIPSLEELEELMSSQTRAVVLNSPNNPSGIHYPKEWMSGFAELMKKYPDTVIISDEIYYHLNYFDPKPTFFYQTHSELLQRTLIVDGISKSLACTGLRIGYLIAPKNITQAVAKLQGQTASGANSLMQRALLNFDLNTVETYLEPIKLHLRENSRILGDALRQAKLNSCWYQTASAFYFLLDLSQTPVMESYKKSKDDSTDYASLICEDLLESKGVAIVPGADFGAPNTARLSLVSPSDQFKEAIDRLVAFLTAV